MSPDSAPEQSPMMKDDEESVDPLDELLDAYKTSVYMGLGELADSIMKIVHELQMAIVQDNPMKPTRKGYSVEYDNPVACLSKAYLALLKKPEWRIMASKVLQLLDIAATQVYSQDVPDMGEMNQSPTESEGEGNGGYMEGMPVMLGGSGRFYSVRREIRQEGGQFCVFSQTGRAFGCYESRDKALKRLAQLEQFTAERLSKAEKSVLIEMHDAAHHLPTVTEAIKTIHDLVSDELQIVHGMSEPFIFEPEQMLEVLEGKDATLISKAAEYRYTLGPAYVPNMEDAHGEFTDEVTLQKAMWDWVRKGDRTIYLQHSDKPAGEMVEMLTWPFPIEADLTVPNQGVSKFMFPADTPFLGVIWEPWAWDMVKAGELRGYSIGGGANRVEADIPAAATMFNKGEAAGHPFRGNQHTSPSGGGGSGGPPSTSDSFEAREAMDSAVGDAQSSLDSYSSSDRFEQGKADEAKSKLREATQQLDKVDSGGDTNDAALLSNARNKAQSAATTLQNADDPALRSIGRDLAGAIDKTPIFRP